MRARALLLAFLVGAASMLTAVQANAAGTVYIYKVYFDSPGSDTGSNSSLNAEYVVIKNGDNVSHSISEWTVRDRAGSPLHIFGRLPARSWQAGRHSHRRWHQLHHLCQYAPVLGSGMVCVEQHWRQGDPATRGQLSEGHLFLQRCRQQEVLLKAIKNKADAWPTNVTA
jgi:hypothetical protein